MKYWNWYCSKKTTSSGRMTFLVVMGGKYMMAIITSYIVCIICNILISYYPGLQVGIARFLLFRIELFECLCVHKYFSLTWCAVTTGSSHLHPLFSSWEFFLDRSSQDRSQTGDTNVISQVARDSRLFSDLLENGYLDWSQGHCVLCYD